MGIIMNNETNFQTPDWVCDIMTARILDLYGEHPNTILEPTQGEGNLVRSIKRMNPNSTIYTPKDFFTFNKRIDLIVGNPPFSPMSIGYDILERCFKLSDNIIMLMPWLSLINSVKRTLLYKERGLRTVIHLPRNAFKGSRVQTCILLFKRGYTYKIELELEDKDLSVPFSGRLDEWI